MAEKRLHYKNVAIDWFLYGTIRKKNTDKLRKGKKIAVIRKGIKGVGHLDSGSNEFSMSQLP